MVKKIILTLSLMALGTTKPFFLDKIFKQLLEHQKETFLNLEDNVHDIIVNISTQYNWRHDEWQTNYNYQFLTSEAKAAFTDYQNAEGSLYNQLMHTTMGDGFILGALVACLNKAFNGDRFNKKAAFATIAAAIGMVLYQNKKLGKAAYFDAGLNTWDNQFDNVSLFTLGRVLSALAAASASYLGTDYALSRAVQIAQDVRS